MPRASSSLDDVEQIEVGALEARGRDTLDCARTTCASRCTAASARNRRARTAPRRRTSRSRCSTIASRYARSRARTIGLERHAARHGRPSGGRRGARLLGAERLAGARQSALASGTTANGQRGCSGADRCCSCCIDRRSRVAGIARIVPMTAGRARVTGPHVAKSRIEL